MSRNIFGWDLPPGVTTSMLPGNTKEEQEAEALHDKLYDGLCKLVSDEPSDELIEYIYKQIGEAYHLGYAQGMADEAEANRVE